MLTLEQYHEYLQHSINSEKEARGLGQLEAFAEIVCEDLRTVGDLTDDYTPAEYIKDGIEVLGYEFDAERMLLSLVTHQFFQENAIQTLTLKLIEKKFTKLKSFFEKCTQRLHENLEETSEAYSMAYNISRYFEKNEVSRLRLIIFTDGKQTKNLKKIASDTFLGIDTEYRIIDIEYLKSIYESNANTANFEVPVDLAYLQINNTEDPYISYLAVIKGSVLVDIYEQYGQKLFEQNVRTFLQFKGGVNKGIRNTIEYRPEMFFAYNNGITATADKVEIGKDGRIKTIYNFQIVNGGQTTSAIYAANKTSKLDVSKVAVQMKLSVIKDKDAQDSFISKVAEYANTQNKINNSDFFSNSPFHKDMKEYSKQILAPATGGSQKRTYWFYERVRGEYLNNQAYLKTDEKNRFLIENPKTQVVDKTLLSKTENLWLQKPEIVCKGAQKSFKKFAEHITEKLEKDNLSINEGYFKDAIARVILFKATEKIVSDATWYDRGYRAQTVAYTISLLYYTIEKSNQVLNFGLVWNRQEVPLQLLNLLEQIAVRVYDVITKPITGYAADIRDWTKNIECWNRVKQLNININDMNSSFFIDSEEEKYTHKAYKDIKKIDIGAEQQIFVYGIKQEIWKEIYAYFKSDKSVAQLTSMQIDILKKMSLKQITNPSEKQSKILYDICMAASKEGVNLT